MRLSSLKFMLASVLALASCLAHAFPAISLSGPTTVSAGSLVTYTVVIEETAAGLDPFVGAELYIGIDTAVFSLDSYSVGNLQDDFMQTGFVSANLLAANSEISVGYTLSLGRSGNFIGTLVDLVLQVNVNAPDTGTTMDFAQPKSSLDLFDLTGNTVTTVTDFTARGIDVTVRTAAVPSVPSWLLLLPGLIALRRALHLPLADYRSRLARGLLSCIAIRGRDRTSTQP